MCATNPTNETGCRQVHAPSPLCLWPTPIILHGMYCACRPHLMPGPPLWPRNPMSFMCQHLKTSSVLILICTQTTHPCTKQNILDDLLHNTPTLQLPTQLFPCQNQTCNMHLCEQLLHTTVFHRFRPFSTVARPGVARPGVRLSNTSS